MLVNSIRRGTLDDKFLIKTIKHYVYKDCLKEEKEVVDKIGNKFGKYCNDIILDLIKKLKEG